MEVDLTIILSRSIKIDPSQDKLSVLKYWCEKTTQFAVGSVDNERLLLFNERFFHFSCNFSMCMFLNTLGLERYNKLFNKKMNENDYMAFVSAREREKLFYPEIGHITYDLDPSIDEEENLIAGVDFMADIKFKIKNGVQ